MKFSIKKKSIPAATVEYVTDEPTLEQRVSAANLSADAYVGMFESAISGLEGSARSLQHASQEARGEAASLTDLADDAEIAAELRFEQAANIRALIGASK